MDDLALLRLELGTLWVTDLAGHLRHERTHVARRAPLLAVASGQNGACWATSIEVPAATAARVVDLLAPTASADAVGWRPDRAAEIVQVLQELEPAATAVGGPSYVVDQALPQPNAVDLLTSADARLDDLVDLLPEADRSLATPWVVALVDGDVAAVCETARSAPSSVEAGLWTYEPYRRRGFGVAVTAAWSTFVTGRTAFYSTSWDNEASRGVARRLGLRPIGHWWQVIAGI